MTDPITIELSDSTLSIAMRVTNIQYKRCTHHAEPRPCCDVKPHKRPAKPDTTQAAPLGVPRRSASFAMAATACLSLEIGATDIKTLTLGDQCIYASYRYKQTV